MECRVCPRGALCDRPGVTRDTLSTAAGYWMLKPGSDSEAEVPEFLSCLRVTHCAAGQSSSDCLFHRAGGDHENNYST
jgi:hypothetical protein